MRREMLVPHATLWPHSNLNLDGTGTSTSTMRFEFYHPGIENIPKLSVDGTVANSIHFSHWQGNGTPAEVKADTSTEIALNLVLSPNRSELTDGIELITNNHFDTDGVLSVWTMLNGEQAIELKQQLISAAEAGDFSELTSDAGVKASIAIQGSDQPRPGAMGVSPIASHLANGTVEDEARAYDLTLPEVEKILTKIDDYEHLWRDGWDQITRAMETFASGASNVIEFADSTLSLVFLAPDAFGPHGFDPTQHAPPFTAISRHARGRLFLIATPLDEGWAYRIDYPYYSWAETAVRPMIPRLNFSEILAELNQAEKEPAGRWQVDNGEMTSAVKFLDVTKSIVASRLEPNEVAGFIRAAFSAHHSSAVTWS